MAPIPGALFDVNLIQYLGVAVGPANPVDTDPVDRAARLLGIIYGNLGQIIQVITGDGLATGDALSVAGFNFVYDAVAGDWNRVREGATLGSMMVEDTGLNTNPRRFEADNGFTSAVVARAGGVATNLWVVGLAAVHPAAGRTNGLSTTIYTLEIENSTGGPVTAWLEIGGTVITVPVHVVDNDSVVIPYPAGKAIGDQDVTCNASVNDVVFTLMGTQI